MRALNDPVFASARLLKSALDAPISFSLVLADGFSVCYEGPHARAWSASAAVGAFVVIGFPLIGIWATSANSAGAQTFVRKFHAALSAALLHKNIRPQTSAFPFWSLILSAVLVGTASLASRTVDTKEFVGLMSLGIAAPLVFAAGTLRSKPHQGVDAWQNWGMVSLLVLSSVSSACSIFLWYARASDTASSAAYVPLIFAIPLPFGIFIAWWRALAREHVIAKLFIPTPVQDEGGADKVQIQNPLHVAHENNGANAPTTTGGNIPVIGTEEVDCTVNDGVHVSAGLDDDGCDDDDVDNAMADDEAKSSDGDDDGDSDGDPFDWASRARAQTPPPTVSKREGISTHVVDFLSSANYHNSIAHARKASMAAGLFSPSHQQTPDMTPPSRTTQTGSVRPEASITPHVADFLNSAKLQNSVTAARQAAECVEQNPIRRALGPASRRTRWEVGTTAEGSGFSFVRPVHSVPATRDDVGGTAGAPPLFDTGMTWARGETKT